MQDEWLRQELAKLEENHEKRLERIDKRYGSEERREAKARFWYSVFNTPFTWFLAPEAILGYRQFKAAYFPDMSWFEEHRECKRYSRKKREIYEKAKRR